MTYFGKPIDAEILRNLRRYGIDLSTDRPHGPGTEQYLAELLILLETDPDSPVLLGCEGRTTRDGASIGAVA